MTIDHRQNHLEAVRNGLAVLLYPVQYIVNLPFTGGAWIAEGLTTRQQLQEENASLRAKHLLLQAQLQKLESLQAENMRLRELLESSVQVGERVLIAEIMAVDMEPFSRQLVINKGLRHDVYKGQPLLDAEGVMGQVVEVSPLTSTAMLITDPSHAIPVVVNRNGLRAIAVGTGNPNRLEVPHLPNNADIRDGDLLISSGLGGRFPPGYPVGRVREVRLDPSRPFATVAAEPLAQLERSREVLLVWRRHGSLLPEEDRADCGTDQTPPCETVQETAGETEVAAP